MPGPAVLIAAAERLPALSARHGHEREVLAFADTEALRAIEAIVERRPGLLLLDREFASSPRGTALIGRVRADPSLVDTQIRIVSHTGAAEDDALSTGSASSPHAAPLTTPSPEATARTTSAGAHPGLHGAPVLDQRGTRRAPRFPVGAGVEVLVDGAKSSLVDISRLGAQILAPTIFRPNQQVRLTLTDAAGTIRCGAHVVWAAFELPKGMGPRYRLGVHFVAPDLARLDQYIERHRAT